MGFILYIVAPVLLSLSGAFRDDGKHKVTPAYRSYKQSERNTFIIKNKREKALTFG
jgi:hypothetical protein